jgi:acetyl esterase/lipase
MQFMARGQWAAIARRGALLMTAMAFMTGAAGAAEVSVKRDISYDTEGKSEPRHTLDLYVPQGDGPRPVLLFLFGGGLFQGNKEDYAKLGEFLAQKGWLTAIPNYRLSPKFQHPAHVSDAAAAFDWVADHARENGGDPTRIAVVGHSAGGYLAALLALDSRYLAARGHSPDEIAAVVPISGFFHVDRIAPTRPPGVWGPEPRDWRQASPALYVSQDAPAMLLLYADGDAPERRQESQDLASALRNRGDRKIDVEQIADRDHISIIRKFGSENDATASRVLDYLAKTVRDRPAQREPLPKVGSGSEQAPHPE